MQPSSRHLAIRQALAALPVKPVFHLSTAPRIIREPLSRALASLTGARLCSRALGACQRTEDMWLLLADAVGLLSHAQSNKSDRSLQPGPIGHRHRPSFKSIACAASGATNPYHTVWAAVVFSAWYCGLGPSILSVIAGALGVSYLFLAPYHSFRIARSADAFGFRGVLDPVGFDCGHGRGQPPFAVGTVSASPPSRSRQRRHHRTRRARRYRQVLEPRRRAALRLVGAGGHGQANPRAPPDGLPGIPGRDQSGVNSQRELARRIGSHQARRHANLRSQPLDVAGEDSARFRLLAGDQPRHHREEEGRTGAAKSACRTGKSRRRAHRGTGPKQPALAPALLAPAAHPGSGAPPHRP